MVGLHVFEFFFERSGPKDFEVPQVTPCRLKVPHVGGPRVTLGDRRAVNDVIEDLLALLCLQELFIPHPSALLLVLS